MTTSKAEIRRLVRERERSMPESQRLYSDMLLCRGFLELPEYKSAKSLLLYCGVGAEVRTDPIIADALGAGKIVALPKITGPGLMEARRIENLDSLVPGPYNIPEPEGGEVVDPRYFDLILVPGAAFTPKGGRLGRGGGYYDRYLASAAGVKAAMVRKIFIFDTLPLEKHDINVDILIIR